jgi:membrane fusion protein, multidrug efflux system
MAKIITTLRKHPVLTSIALLTVLLLGWAMLSVTGNKQKGARGVRQGQVPVVTIAPVSKKDVPIFLDGLGSIQASNTVTVRSQVEGQLMEVLFREGQDVRKGEVLARIDPRPYQAQLEQAQATKARDAALLENARRDLRRYIDLGNMIPRQTTDTQRTTVLQLEATVKADQAAIENARTELGYSTITSPINGRTGLRQVDAGNIVRPSDANGLVVITQLEPIAVLFSLPQQNLQAINEAINEQETLTVQALSNDKVIDTGTLQLIDNQIDPTTGTIRLKASFPNSKRLMWPGGFVNVRLLVTTREDALVIPAVAIQRGAQHSYVFVLKDDKTVEMRPVVTSLTVAQDAVIDSGLKEGEKVVIDGAGKLQDGSKVALPGEVMQDVGGKEGKKHRGRKASP